MAALISVFIAITLSLLITRIATEALTLTGLSLTSASFQARSAVLVRDAKRDICGAVKQFVAACAVALGGFPDLS